VFEDKTERRQRARIVVALGDPAHGEEIVRGHGCAIQDDDRNAPFANAHLIAAAPDLYEALEALTSDEHAGDVVLSLDVKCAIDLHNAATKRVLARQEAARAALAKARGEASE
jgi:hypothetical protein